MRRPRDSYDDAANLTVQDLVESLHKLPKNEPFSTINDTHHAALRILAELFNIIPKFAEQQSTNRHSGRRQESQEVAAEPDQVTASVTHRHSKRQQQHQKPAPRIQAQKIKPGIPLRVDPSKMPMVTQEK